MGSPSCCACRGRTGHRRAAERRDAATAAGTPAGEPGPGRRRRARDPPDPRHQPAGPRLRRRPRPRRRAGPRARRPSPPRRRWSSTSGCPGSTASTSSPACAGWSHVPIVVLSARDAEAAQGRGPRRRRRRLRHEAVRDGRAPRPPPGRAAPRRAGRRGRRHRHPGLHDRPGQQAGHPRRRGGPPDARPSGTWSRCSCATPGKLVSSRQLLQEVWGPGYEKETHYLRVFMAHVRRKLEPEPSQPRYFHTEPGMGYRFIPG